MRGLTEARCPCRGALVLRVHPYVRVYCAIVLGAAAAIAWSPVRLSEIFVIALAVSALAGVCARELLPLAFSLITLYGGLAILSALSGMSASEMRPTQYAIFAGRCASAFLAFRALFVTTHHTEIVRALEKLRLPRVFTAVAGSIFRWLWLIQTQAIAANNARLLRGGDRRGKVAQIRDLGHISVALMLRSVARAERLASAMECRGFSGKLVGLGSETLPLTACTPLAGLVVFIATVWAVAP